MFAGDTNISINGKSNDKLQERINVDLENVHAPMHGYLQTNLHLTKIKLNT